MSRYISLSTLCLFIITASISSNTDAQEKKWPVKPVTMVNSWAAGGGLDAMLRPLAKLMQDFLGQPVVVENREGGAGLIGGEYVAKARPDGYTLGGFDSTTCVPEAFSPIRKPPFLSTDLDPISRLAIFPFSLVSRGNTPWKDLNGFMKYVQANPSVVKLGHPGFGHLFQILWWSLAKANNLDVIEIPFQPSNLKAALLGGHIDAEMATPANVLPFLQNGQMKMLAVHNAKRLADFPDVPTFEELKLLPRFPYMFLGIFAPKGTPQDIKKKLDDTVKRALDTQFYKDIAKKNGVTLYYGTPKEVIEDSKITDEIVRPLVTEISKKHKS